MLLCALLGLHCTCADHEYSRVYHESVLREVQSYRHPGTLEEVAADVARLLGEDGYVVEPPANAALVETDWKAIGGEQRNRWSVALSSTPDGVLVYATMSIEMLSPQSWEPETKMPAFDVQRALLLAVRPELVEGRSDADVDSFEHTTAAPVLWDALQRVTAEIGTYYVTYDPPIDATAVTEWIVSEPDARRWRLEARFERREGNRTRVHVERAVEKAVGERSWQSQGETRELSLERALIERRDPERAAVIERFAREQAQGAFDDAIARGAVSCGGCQSCWTP